MSVGALTGALAGLEIAVAFAPHTLWELQARLSRRDVVERLIDPVAVTGFRPDGLTLADGSLLPWNLGEPLLLDDSLLMVLSVLTAQGLERSPGGEAIVLVPVFHWCGNDPVRRHLARVDLRAALQFLGGRSHPDATEPLEFGEPQFTERGWIVRCWLAFERWRGGDP